MQKLKNILKDGIVIFDGANGSEFYRRGIFINSSYEGLNISNPNLVEELHFDYARLGVDVITTNSYGANRQRLAAFGLAEKCEDINIAAAKLATKAIEKFAQECNTQGKSFKRPLVAASVGPVANQNLTHGTTLDHSSASEIFLEQINYLLAGGVDFILGESLSNLNDCKAFADALAKADCEYMVSFSIDNDLLGANNEPLRKLLQVFTESATLRKPSAVGLNCSLGAEEMLQVLPKLKELTSLPIVLQPNSGGPKLIDNRQINLCNPEYFCTYCRRFLELGVRGLGGCCGITPDHIKELINSVKPFAASLKTINIASKKDETLELIEACPPSQRSKFAAKICRGEFIRSVEITPPAGFDLSSTIAKAKVCAVNGIDVINIPDGPRASARISPLVTAYQIQQQANIETVLHFCARDRNLIGIQSELLGCAAEMVNNILFITGDPPKLGDYPFASAVFDVDSVGCLKIAHKLNCGIDIANKKLPSGGTRFFSGSGADPNSLDMAREYARVAEKVKAGATFIITQPVFDKDSLLRFLDNIEYLNVPVIAGIWPLASLKNAEFMKTAVPGVVVPDSIIDKMSKYATKEDQAKAGIEIAGTIALELQNQLQGIQVSAPFGNVETAIKVFEYLK